MVSESLWSVQSLRLLFCSVTLAPPVGAVCGPRPWSELESAQVQQVTVAAGSPRSVPFHRQY